MDKGIDISGHSQFQLNAIAGQLNERPRKTLGFHTSVEMSSECVASTGFNPPAKAVFGDDRPTRPGCPRATITCRTDAIRSFHAPLPGLLPANQALGLSIDFGPLLWVRTDVWFSRPNFFSSGDCSLGSGPILELRHIGIAL
jgi:hypothetical protein